MLGWLVDCLTDSNLPHDSEAILGLDKQMESKFECFARNWYTIDELNRCSGKSLKWLSLIYN